MIKSILSSLTISLLFNYMQKPVMAFSILYDVSLSVADTMMEEDGKAQRGSHLLETDLKNPRSTELDTPAATLIYTPIQLVEIVS